jgi:Cu(I)/Ag(I) efflux system periplasmic protein CusF
MPLEVNTASGMGTLKHGALENIDMPPITMAFKPKYVALLKQTHEGTK